jgi:dihydropteroate synthase
MAVLNLTPDSFSDGGRHSDPKRALAAALRLGRQGADIIDLGPQSSRPGAIEVGVATEQQRLMPVLLQLALARAEGRLPAEILLSVDTFHAAVAAAALAAGANWINDISAGTADPAMLPLVAQAGCPYVLMHRRGNSLSMDKLANYQDVVAEVEAELLQRSEAALRAGIQRRQLIWDPGLGFAKTTAHNIELLRQLPRLASHGFPLLVGPSRKRFIGEVLQEPRPRARLWGTAASICRAVAGGAAVVRVHDVAPAVQLCRMADALWAD